MNSILVLAAALTVDFATAVGPVRPEIHSSGFGPTICSQTAQDLKDVKSMGFKYARTHDWALINPNQRVCDYFHIFPLMHLDVKDPKNYHFGPTDYPEHPPCELYLDIPGASAKTSSRNKEGTNP